MNHNLRAYIYPRTKENVQAIFKFFFPIAKISEIEEVTNKYYDENQYDLSQLEMFAEMISGNLDFFEKEFKILPTLPLMMFYATEAIGKKEEDWTNGSKEMNRIRTGFRDLIISKMLE